MYDIGNEEGFSEIKKITEVPEIKENLIVKDKRQNVFLIANKKDLYKDSDCYKAEGYCVNHRYKYYEISAKKEHSIETIANEMINIFDNNVL